METVHGDDALLILGCEDMGVQRVVGHRNPADGRDTGQPLGTLRQIDTGSGGFEVGIDAAPGGWPGRQG